MFLVTESTWSDVLAAAIGGQRTSNDQEMTRAPSAYLLIYINDEQKSLSNGLFICLCCSMYRNMNLDVHYELTNDLQRTLEEDLNLLQQQIDTIKLDQLYNSLKTTCERIEKSQQMQKLSSLQFFSGPSPPFGKSYYAFK